MEKLMKNYAWNDPSEDTPDDVFDNVDEEFEETDESNMEPDFDCDAYLEDQSIREVQKDYERFLNHLFR